MLSLTSPGCLPRSNKAFRFERVNDTDGAFLERESVRIRGTYVDGPGLRAAPGVTRCLCFWSVLLGICTRRLRGLDRKMSIDQQCVR